ncbi:hypothetical protein PCASD_08709 [Puccinia coronata f. sp. avenae]|uniref:Uncharacterized protein n=1 Tax=Puccinia coronata f. sp. avenae TaxID=200324 RepID=A0A2N5UG44_9BASI|nr:hypothetical protein PCASD_08709 [Puccinia coronata f. sp. avenae]
MTSYVAVNPPSRKIPDLGMAKHPASSSLIGTQRLPARHGQDGYDLQRLLISAWLSSSFSLCHLAELNRHLFLDSSEEHPNIFKDKTCEQTLLIGFRCATLSPHMAPECRSHASESSGKYREPGSADGISRAFTHTTRPRSPFSNPPSAALLRARPATNCGAAGFASVSAPATKLEYSSPASGFPFPSPAFFSVPSNSSSRSWTPDQTENANPLNGHSELINPCQPFAPLGSPANFEQLPTQFFNHHTDASPPACRPERPSSSLRRLVSNHRPAINTSDASSDGQNSLLSQPSQFHEDPESLIPSPIFSPHPTNFRTRLNEASKDGCPPMTPISLDPPSLRLINPSASYGTSPAWFEPEMFPHINGDPHFNYEGSCSSSIFLTTRNSPLPVDSLPHTPHVLLSQCQSGMVSPNHLGHPTTPASLISGESHENIKPLSGSCRVSLEPVPKPKEARIAGCNKKKKREVREVEAFCIACGKAMARLTLRGSPEELYVADGFDVIHTCKACQEGRLDPDGIGSELGVAPFSERPFFKSENSPEVAIRPVPASQGAVATFRKRNRRTDDVTAPTTCDCCARKLGVGGIVPRNGRSAIQFVVEVVCTHCVSNFRRCTDCGGGGGSRLGVGKWRCKELFSDGRRTCILSHQRQGASTDVITTVWRVKHLTEKPEIDTLVGQLRELVKHSLYAALATPETLESGLARVTTFDEIKTMYANGWKQIQPLIYEDVEASTGRRRYVGLRWTKPHPRKGPKRGGLNTGDQISTPVRESEMVLEPGKELSGFVLSEWDMHKGTFFIEVAMPWQSGDALESTAGLSHKSFVEAKADRERLVNDLVRRGTNIREANLRYPPIRHLWTILFFHRETRLVQFLEKRRKFIPLQEYLLHYPDAKRDMFPPERDCYIPRDEQQGWNIWVRRENGSPPKTPQ